MRVIIDSKMRQHFSIHVCLKLQRDTRNCHKKTCQCDPTSCRLHDLFANVGPHELGHTFAQQQNFVSTIYSLCVEVDIKFKMCIRTRSFAKKSSLCKRRTHPSKRFGRSEEPLNKTSSSSVENTGLQTQLRLNGRTLGNGRSKHAYSVSGGQHAT